MNFKSLYLLTPPGADVNPIMQILPWVGVMLVFYFFMIRPQVKKNKEQKKFREALKVGDKVLTIGGIHGKVKEIADTNVVIEVEGGRMRVEKSALSMDSTPTLGQQK